MVNASTFLALDGCGRPLTKLDVQTSGTLPTPQKREPQGAGSETKKPRYFGEMSLVHSMSFGKAYEAVKQKYLENLRKFEGQMLPASRLAEILSKATASTSPRRTQPWTSTSPAAGC